MTANVRSFEQKWTQETKKIKNHALFSPITKITQIKVQHFTGKSNYFIFQPVNEGLPKNVTNFLKL